MSLDKGTKEEITKKFQLHEKDTGSADVQIAILTERIAELTEHLKLAPKDHSSRLALLKLVGQRRKLLDYLNSTDTKRYQNLIVRLNLRKWPMVQGNEFHHMKKHRQELGCRDNTLFQKEAGEADQ